MRRPSIGNTPRKKNIYRNHIVLKTNGELHVLHNTLRKCHPFPLITFVMCSGIEFETVYHIYILFQDHDITLFSQDTPTSQLSSNHIVASLLQIVHILSIRLRSRDFIGQCKHITLFSRHNNVIIRRVALYTILWKNSTTIWITFLELWRHLPHQHICIFCAVHHSVQMSTRASAMKRETTP